MRTKGQTVTLPKDNRIDRSRTSSNDLTKFVVHGIARFGLDTIRHTPITSIFHISSFIREELMMPRLHPADCGRSGWERHPITSIFRPTHHLYLPTDPSLRSSSSPIDRWMHSFPAIKRFCRDNNNNNLNNTIITHQLTNTPPTLLVLY